MRLRQAKLAVILITSALVCVIALPQLTFGGDSPASSLWTEDWLKDNSGFNPPRYDITNRPFVTVGDAGYSSFSAAVTAIGARQATLILPAGTHMGESVTVPSTLTLKVLEGAHITIATGTTLNINGPFEAGLYQVFSCSGSGQVVFGAGAVKELYPQWWGASPTAPAETNSTAFKAALSALSTNVSVLTIPCGTYQVNRSLAVSTTNGRFTIQGSGMSSILQWTGADDATMLAIIGTYGLSYDIKLKDIRLDGNNKAATLLEISNTNNIYIERVLFSSTKLDKGGEGAALNILTESHNGVVESCWFWDLYSKGINLNRLGSSGGPVNWKIVNNLFTPVHNTSIYGKNCQNILVSGNIIESERSDKFAAGVDFDASGQIIVVNNYYESIYNFCVRLNKTASATTSGISGEIRNNTFNNSGKLGGHAQIELGYTKNVLIRNNELFHIPGGSTLAKLTDAVGTRIGRNPCINTAGKESWEVANIIDSGSGTYYVYSFIPVTASKAVLDLTDQNASTNFNNLSNISNIVTNVPPNAKGWIFQASIKSNTPGARFYVVDLDSVPAWANRDSDKRVHWLEAQVPGRYNTQEFTIKASEDHKDMIAYGIAGTGTNDTDIQLRIVGYLMID